jgi:hypothetical protein
MSNTRHAPQGAPISYEKYMSSSEYAELRAIPGTAVAAKTQLYSDPRKRSLLFFLQSLSLEEGGLRRVGQTLSQRFPKIGREQLVTFLIDLCINPKVAVRFVDENQLASDFDRVIAALCDFQEGYESKVKSEFVLTTIGKEIFETLHHAFQIRKMVVIEGESGIGKTTAAKAWCAEHRGHARFVSLSGINHKTGFFRKLGAAIGLAAAKGKATDLQVRIEDFFRRSRLMLVIDEAHYLWPQYQRSYTSPELIDWVNTALVNDNVPVALICTDQFAKLKARVEKQTGWTSEQLEHRVKRYRKLSNTPTKEDLESVARKLLTMRWNPVEDQWNIVGPAPVGDFIKMVVGYALTCKMRLPAVANTIEEARYQARKHKRSQILAPDIRAALLDYRIPSDEALQQAFENPRGRDGSRPSGEPLLRPRSDLRSRCNRVANVLQ